MTQEQKEEILKQYLQWVDQVCDDFPEKMHFNPEEIVMKVLGLVEEYSE
jgi:hypothetical protein